MHLVQCSISFCRLIENTIHFFVQVPACALSVGRGLWQNGSEKTSLFNRALLAQELITSSSLPPCTGNSRSTVVEVGLELLSYEYELQIIYYIRINACEYHTTQDACSSVTRDSRYDIWCEFILQYFGTMGVNNLLLYLLLFSRNTARNCWCCCCTYR